MTEDCHFSQCNKGSKEQKSQAGNDRMSWLANCPKQCHLQRGELQRGMTLCMLLPLTGMLARVLRHAATLKQLCLQLKHACTHTHSKNKHTTTQTDFVLLGPCIFGETAKRMVLLYYGTGLLGALFTANILLPKPKVLIKVRWRRSCHS